MEIEQKIIKYIEELNDYSLKEWGSFSKSTFDYTEGKRYFKIWQTLCNSQKCIFAFIDEDGNIYKPEGLNKPANGTRGNLDGFKPLDARQLYKR